MNPLLLPGLIAGIYGTMKAATKVKSVSNAYDGMVFGSNNSTAAAEARRNAARAQLMPVAQ